MRIGRTLRDRGMATAEFAVALPALVLLLGFSLGAVDATMDKLSCVDAARIGALAASRGDDGAAAARAQAPSGSSISVARTADDVRVTVSVRAVPFGPHLPGIAVTASATAALEPGVGA